MLMPIPLLVEKALVRWSAVRSPIQIGTLIPPKPWMVCCTVLASIVAVAITPTSLASSALFTFLLSGVTSSRCLVQEERTKLRERNDMARCLKNAVVFIVKFC
jgi:integral membrane sensor domain MASE1